jgi:hypothetical protein
MKKQNNILPSPKQMRDFAHGFDIQTWNVLCENKVFINLVCEDLIAAKKLSKEILKEKHK